MCGLLFSSISKVSLNKFTNSLNLMIHRGPDYTGIKEFPKNIFLGHNRLQILDLNPRSHQPFQSSKGYHHIIFNGEIFNFLELKKRFKISTKTNSDTEILLELYLLLGEKTLDYLNGMYAFVIFNSFTGEVFAARDRLGIKPLYYMRFNNEIIFASEIGAILKLVGEDDIDVLGVRQYMKARAFFNGRTLYKNIKMFPAGHFYKNNMFYEYWALPTEDGENNVDDEILQNLVEDSIKLCCVSDVPIGIFLSGGIDSTVIAGLACKADTWSVGFNEMNEFKWAQKVAKKYKTSHHDIIINEQEFLEIATTLIQKRREPLSVPNEVLIYKMSKEVKNINTVVLSGEGADESFFGYDRIFKWAMNSAWSIEKFDHYYSYGSHKDFEILEDILEPVSKCRSSASKVSLFFQRYHLHGLLRRLDNSTMMCSVEGRVPFVDHRLVEYMHGIRASDKIVNNIAKAPLKRIFQNLIPKEIILREKVGFPVPLDRVFSNSRIENKMDKWLDFNLSIVLGEAWPKIREEITHFLI